MYKCLSRCALICLLIFSFVEVHAEDEIENNDNETSSIQDSSPEADAPAPSPVPVETIVVTARFDYCDPEVMQRRLSRSVRTTCMNCLLEPGSNYCGAPSCAVDFFSAGIGNTTVRELDLKSKKLNLFSGYQSRTIESWEAWSARYPLVKVETGKDFKSALQDRHNYYLSIPVNFDEMYDADFKEITVYCPSESCFGVNMNTSSGHMFYLEITQAGAPKIKKLIVNAGVGSKIKKQAGPEPSLERCQNSP